MMILGTLFCAMEFFNLYYHFQFSHVEATVEPEIINADMSVDNEERKRQEAWINSLATERIEAAYGMNVMQAADAAWTVGAFAIMTVLVCASA